MSQVVRSVVVSPPSAKLIALNLTQKFSADARDGNQKSVAGQMFTWTSDNILIALVDQTGLATALAFGDAIVTATTGGVSGTASLHVGL